MRNVSLPALAALGLASTLALAPAALAAPTSFEIDRAHSSVTFKVRHLLGKVPGKFKQFSGTVTIDPDKRDSVEVSASIDVASIDTDESKRDEHLRGADFFDAARFPAITFQGNTLSDVNADRTKARLTGSLTMHGVTKPVVLDVEWMGTAKDPWGNQQAVFSGTTKLNRKDFAIIWNKTLDGGGYLIGEEVDIEINVEAQIPKAAK